MLTKLYESRFGTQPEAVIPLTPAGSNRRYFRLTGAQNAVGVIGNSIDENSAFIYLSRHFKSKVLPVPEVFAVSPDGLSYLQEDLGDCQLFEIRDSVDLLKKTIAVLPDFQYRGAEGLDFAKCYPVSDFDAQAMLWDLNYFKYCFLNTSGVAYREDLLESEFRKMATRLADGVGQTFMYRDFQSRNVMIKDGTPYFIDFQGGRRGPAEYDVVSFVTQARAAFPEAVRRELVATYIDSASRYVSIDLERFDERFREFSLLRSLQVLGAYGFRGRFERKAHFLKSIPPALKSLAALLEKPFAEYPYLNTVVSQMLEKELQVCSDESSLSAARADDKRSSLTVTVASFSYKKGIPTDESGNGGGFVFDCRAMLNPGRYDEYKTITGLDRPVIDFLERQGEVQPFLEHCYGLVDPAVECYDRRGFTSLSVNFGCTGGQHRSVYCAQHLAEHIKRRFPTVNVHLIHREQNIDKCL